MVLKVPMAKEDAASLIELELRSISVGVWLLAAVLTTFASVKVMLPEPALLVSAVAAV